MKDSEVDVTVTLHHIVRTVPPDLEGWPIGFKERFFGAYPDAPEEPDELELGEPNPQATAIGANGDCRCHRSDGLISDDRHDDAPPSRILQVAA